MKRFKIFVIYLYIINEYTLQFSNEKKLFLVSYSAVIATIAAAETKKKKN